MGEGERKGKEQMRRIQEGVLLRDHDNAKGG